MVAVGSHSHVQAEQARYYSGLFCLPPTCRIGLGLANPPDALPGNLSPIPSAPGDLAASALPRPGGFYFSEVLMATMKSSMSALIVTPPRSLTSEQVDHVRAEIARQLPADTTVVVVPTGFTVHPLSLAPSSVELQPGQADLIYQHMAVVGELQKIGAGIADAIAALGSVPMRVEP